MKNDMKLIMESWRAQAFLVENDAAAVGDKLEGDLENIFDAAGAEVQKKLESELNEGAITIAIVLYHLWVTLIGSAALGAVITKFSKWFMKKTTNRDTSGLEKTEAFFDAALENLATGGTKNWIAKPIIKKLSDANNLQANLDKLDMVYKLFAIMIAIGVSGSEIFTNAKEAGGYKAYITEIFTKAGIESADALSATLEAFDKVAGTADDTFDGIKFIKLVGTRIGNYLRSP